MADTQTPQEIVAAVRSSQGPAGGNISQIADNIRYMLEQGTETDGTTSFSAGQMTDLLSHLDDIRGKGIYAVCRGFVSASRPVA